MNEILTVTVILFITAIGMSMIRHFDLLPGFSLAESMPYGYGIGIGSIYLQLFLYARLNIPWNVLTILLPWIISILVLIFWKKQDKIPLLPKLHVSTTTKIFMVFIVILVMYVGFEALLRPLYAWDGWSNWLLKSKVFYIDGFIDRRFFSYVQSEYPLVVSLAGTFLYIVLGTVDDKAVLLLFYAFYIAVAAAVFFALNRVIGTVKASLFTFLLISTQNLIRHGGRYEAGYADLILGFYIFTSVILLLQYMHTKRSQYIVITSFFIGVSALVKNEGMPFFIIMQIMLFIEIYRNKHVRYILFSLFGLAMVVDWQLYKILHNFPPAPSYIHQEFSMARIPEVSVAISKEFVNLQNWNLLWITFIVSFILAALKRFRSLPYILPLILLTQLLVYGGIFLITNVDPSAHIRNVMDRLLLHLAPLAVYFIALVSHEEKITPLHIFTRR
jgi:hypothetical protein